MRSERIVPPGRGEASMMWASMPDLRREWAQTRPEIPAPTMRTGTRVVMEFGNILSSSIGGAGGSGRALGCSWGDVEVRTA